MDVDVARGGDRVGCRAGAEDAGQGRATTVAENELRGVLGTCEGKQCRGYVVAEDLVVGPAERLDEEVLGCQGALVALAGSRAVTEPGHSQ